MTTATAITTASELIAAGEALYTEVSGGTVSTKAASNINNVGSIASVALSLLENNTTFDIATLISGIGGVIVGTTEIVQVFKKTTTATTTTTTAAS